MELSYGELRAIDDTRKLLKSPFRRILGPFAALMMILSILMRQEHSVADYVVIGAVVLMMVALFGMAIWQARRQEALLKRLLDVAERAEQTDPANQTRRTEFEGMDRN